MSKATILATVDRQLAEDDPELREEQYRSIAAKTARLLKRGVPANTRVAYERDQKLFREWCERQRPPMPWLPTNEPALLGFLLEIGYEEHTDPKKHARQKYLWRLGTIERRLSGILWHHAVEKDLNPITPRVQKLLHAIKVDRTEERGVHEHRKARPLRLADLRKIFTWSDQKPKRISIRNMAMLAVGWTCALRRSEIAALLLSDVRRDKRGYVVRIRRSKADQLGEGAQLPVSPRKDLAMCPVARLDRWLEVRGDTPGPLFSRRTKKAEHSRITPGHVCAVVGQLSVKAGVWSKGDGQRDLFEPFFSAHSLRAGFITEAVRNKKPDHEVMKQSRHKTHRVFAGYVRMVETVEDNVADDVDDWEE